MLRPLVVGICGASASGKSSLASFLRTRYDCISLIAQDGYASPDRCPVFNGSKWTFTNWEHENTMDWDSLVRDIAQARQQCADSVASGEGQEKRKIVIVEGFLLLWDPRIAPMLDVKLFLDISKDASYQRRVARASDPITYYISEGPEREEALRHDWFRVYFDELIWPTYLLHRPSVESYPDLVVLPADNPRELIQAQAAAIIDTFVPL